MSRPLRIGLAGAGMISQHHLIGWSRVKDADVVAICDPDRERAKDRAALFDIPSVFTDVAEMLDQAALDALDIASPRETHADNVRLALARGIDVQCQKPLTPTLAESEGLVDEAAGGIRLMVHENWRFRPFYRRVKGWLEDGRIGAVQQLRLASLSCGLLPDPEGRRPALERQPFMQHETRLAIAESLIHHLDVVRWLAGPLSVVAARTARTVDIMAGETMASIYLRTRSGSPVLVEGNMAAPGYPARAQDRLELIGSESSVNLRGGRLHLAGPEPETHVWDLDAAYQESFDAAIAHFVQCLDSGEPFETDAVENLETLRLVEAAYEAAGGP